MKHLSFVTTLLAAIATTMAKTKTNNENCCVEGTRNRRNSIRCLIIQQHESKSRVKSTDYKSVRDLAATAADIS